MCSFIIEIVGNIWKSKSDGTIPTLVCSNSGNNVNHMWTQTVTIHLDFSTKIHVNLQPSHTFCVTREDCFADFIVFSYMGVFLF